MRMFWTKPMLLENQATLYADSGCSKSQGALPDKYRPLNDMLNLVLHFTKCITHLFRSIGLTD